jgi:hypothetical protein
MGTAACGPRKLYNHVFHQHIAERAGACWVERITTALFHDANKKISDASVPTISALRESVF